MDSWSETDHRFWYTRATMKWKIWSTPDGRRTALSKAGEKPETPGKEPDFEPVDVFHAKDHATAVRRFNRWARER